MTTLKQLRYCLAVADFGSLTKAATHLFIAQPALTRQIAQLESELGFAVFQRTARGVSLTPGGRLYCDRIRPIARQLTDAAEAGNQLAQGRSGLLRLSHSSSIPLASLLPHIQRFLAETGNARIEFDRISSEQQITEIAAGRGDIGLIRLPVLKRDPTLQFIELPAEQLYAALPVAHRLGRQPRILLSDLAEEAFVSAVHRERGGLARRVADLCLTRGFVPKLARTVSRKTSMLDLVGAGLGIAVVPERMARPHRADIIFKPLADPDAHAGIAILLPPAPSPLAKHFAELLREGSLQ